MDTPQFITRDEMNSQDQFSQQLADQFSHQAGDQFISKPLGIAAYQLQEVVDRTVAELKQES